ncbi:hypothetical protein [Streptomyces sp. NPDC052012]|uniref:hypothetical protein n=1 Tax=Streptomyces sp. NPDC052012 TaxID=3155051 RepID=UPI0034509F96
MTWSAALPEAAMRAMRTAAGWRALRPVLRVVVLAGAVFVLGVLCGERAEAAERTPTGASVVRMASEAARSVAAPDTRADSDDSARPGSIGEVAERGVTAVAELVDEAVAASVPKSPEAAPLRLRLPKVPEAPSLPVLPVLSGTTGPVPLPDLPAGLDLPRRTLPAPLTPEAEPDPVPVPAPAQSPEPGSESAAEQGTEPGNAATPPPADSPTPSRQTDPLAAAPHGPEWTRTSTTPAAPRTGIGSPSVRGDEPAVTSRTGEADPAPAPRAPGGRPDGSLGSRSATDHGQPRPGDTHAVTSHHPRPLPLLVRAAPAHTETTEPRDRFEDVPVPPA